ncbi:hypothetical protein [Streptomyces sp. NPDC001536]|uniref:hypothetical protein n=1 Tax=Streptomyces sp. NPDC001536 TaxID=3364583 RepID=UPI003677D2F1
MSNDEDSRDAAMAAFQEVHGHVGELVARLEARIAVPLIFARLRGLALDGEPAYRPSAVSRALSCLPACLPVTFEPATNEIVG